MKRLKILFLSCFLFLTACQSGMNDSDLPAESPIEEEERSTTEDGYSTRDQEGKIDEDNMDWAEREEWKGTGLYKGKVESNAVEIEIDNELKTFKLTKEAEKDVEYLDDDEKVSYIYYEEEGENIIEFIEKSEYDDRPRHRHRHHNHEHHKHHQHHRHH